MNKLITLTVLVTLNFTTLFGQCTSLFSFAAYFETVTFINQSNVANAHYYWNFGDGTSSYLQNPTHRFPETGNYLVTLFTKDTVSSCSSYYEYWLTVTKYSTDSCQTGITYSFFNYNGSAWVETIDNSANCNSYYPNYDCAGTSNFPPPNYSSPLGVYMHGRFIARVQYYDTSFSKPKREAYNTVPYKYSSAKNYGDCSANFEFSVVSQDLNGQTILFKAMNSSATYYKWIISGFGNPIFSNYDTISHYYPFNSNDLWVIGLETTGSAGCKDTLYQQILVRDSILTFTGISEIQKQISYQLFPNPFTQQAVLQFPSIKQKTTFTLFNANGQLVKTINNITDGQAIINRDGISTGLYYFMLWTDDRIIATGKLVAE